MPKTFEHIFILSNVLEEKGKSGSRIHAMVNNTPDPGAKEVQNLGADPDLCHRRRGFGERDLSKILVFKTRQSRHQYL
jgi:hypothetical protein